MEAKYIPLANELRKDILSGKYGAFGGLPGASEIASSQAIAINTVKAALTLLEREGIIVKRGIGYFVNIVPTVMTRHVSTPEDRLQEHSRQGYVTNVEIAQVQIPAHIATKLGLNSPLEATKRTQVSGELIGSKQYPHQYTQRYYFIDLSAEEIASMRDHPNFDPMWTRYPTPLHTQDEPSARNATREEAVHLDLPQNTAILSMLEVIRSENGDILLMAQELTLSPRIQLVYNYIFDNRPK